MALPLMAVVPAMPHLPMALTGREPEKIQCCERPAEPGTTKAPAGKHKPQGPDKPAEKSKGKNRWNIW